METQLLNVLQELSQRMKTQPLLGTQLLLIYCPLQVSIVILQMLSYYLLLFSRLALNILEILDHVMSMHIKGLIY